jgi:hypothetical protein
LLVKKETFKKLMETKKNVQNTNSGINHMQRMRLKTNKSHPSLSALRLERQVKKGVERRLLLHLQRVYRDASSSTCKAGQERCRETPPPPPPEPLPAPPLRATPSM